MPLFRPKPTPFRLTYGTVLPGHRGGGTSSVLTEGFRVRDLSNAPYRYLIECSCSAEKIFSLMMACADLVGSPCMAILEVHEEKAVTTYASTAFPKGRVLEVFGQYAFRLVNDGFTGFGLASGAFEVFLTDHKWVRIYCSDLPPPEAVMKTLGVPKRKEITLIGVGPHYHLPIGALFDEKVARLCEPLPAEEADEHRVEPNTYEGFRQPIIRQLDMVVDKRVAE